MKTHKQSIRPTNDSERSPAVHYANWKETIFLRKKLATINKTERGLVHRITVDQKVVFRRFQNRLLRTKIAQARASNDKQLVNELRDQDMRKLHCESHLSNQGDSSFLDKLEKTPCTFESEADGKVSGKNGGVSDKAITNGELTSLVQAVMKNQPIEHTSRNLRRLSALGHILDMARAKGDITQDHNTKTFKERPLTAGNAHPEGVQAPLRNTNRGSKSVTDVSSGKYQNEWGGNDNDKLEVKETNSLKRPKLTNTILVNLGSRSNGHAKSSEQTNVEENEISLEDLMDRLAFDSNNNKVDNTLLSTRVNAKLSAAQTPRTTTSIFEDVKRPDYRGMRLEKAKKIDHSNQVRGFIEGLASLGQGVPDFDYYASKMQTNAALQVKAVLPVQMPATPDEVYQKYTGDQTISCITLPKVKMRKVKDDNHQDNEAFIFSMDNFSVNVYDSWSSVVSEVEDEED